REHMDPRADDDVVTDRPRACEAHVVQGAFGPELLRKRYRVALEERATVNLGPPCPVEQGRVRGAQDPAASNRNRRDEKREPIPLRRASLTAGFERPTLLLRLDVQPAAS